MKAAIVLLLLVSTVFLSGCINVEKKSEKSNEISRQATTTTTFLAAKTTIATTRQTSILTTTTIVTTIPSTQASTTTLPSVCASDGDCPKARNSSNYCWNGDHAWGGDDKNIYMDEIEYVCSGKGTPSARCVEARKRINVDRCVASKCFNGLCYSTHCFNQRLDESEEKIDCGGVDCPDCSLKPNITCFNDCDCLSREAQFYTRFYTSCKLNQISASVLAIEDSKCEERDIYQKLVSYKCVKPGTEKSKCTSEFSQYMMTASCRDKNCTLDCWFKTTNYPNLALLNNKSVSFISIE